MSGNQEGHSSELAIFQSSVLDTGIEAIEWVDFRPVSQLTSDGAVEFNIAGNSISYLDLKRTRLHLKVRILTENGTAVAQEDDVALTNLPLQAMWSQVDVALQQQVGHT